MDILNIICTNILHGTTIMFNPLNQLQLILFTRIHRGNNRNKINISDVLLVVYAGSMSLLYVCVGEGGTNFGY